MGREHCQSRQTMAALAIVNLDHSFKMIWLGDQGVGNVFRKFLWNQLILMIFQDYEQFEGIFGPQIDSED